MSPLLKVSPLGLAGLLPMKISPHMMLNLSGILPLKMDNFTHNFYQMLRIRFKTITGYLLLVPFTFLNKLKCFYHSVIGYPSQVSRDKKTRIGK